MNISRKSGFRIGTALVPFVAAIGFIPSAAFAQDSAAPPATCADGSGVAANSPDCKSVANADGSSQDAGSIVVTGSRIRRDSFNTPDPITVVTRDEVIQSGFNSTSEVLQSASFTNGAAQINNSFGGFVTNGGPGANTLSLRGLGATRTLILLNGRRVAPAGSRGSVGSADLNVLPDAMIERIEVLNGGASSIYGSDAVAGVVNIVTRNKFKGIYVEGQSSFPEAGAGSSQRLSAVFGFHGDRFDFSGSLEYYNRDAYRIKNAPWAMCQTSYRKADAASAPGTGDFIDKATNAPKCYPTGNTGESGVTVNTIGTPNLSATSVALGLNVPTGYTGICNRFRPNSSAGLGLPGYECVGGGTLALGVRDTFPLSILNDDLISPARVYTGFFQGSYDLQALGNAQIYAELLLNRRKSSQLSNRQFTIDYPWHSPLVPASLTFSSRFLPPQATNPTVDVGVRVFADYGNYDNRQQVDYIKATVGMRGDLPANWRYDFYLSKAWSDASYTSDLILTDRLNQSLNVVASGSGFVCVDTTRGCVAAPALTAAVVGGQFPQNWFNFVVQPVTGTTAYRESTAALNIDGKLFELPGGPIQLALGAEYRKASIDDEPALDSQNGNLYNFTSSSITKGDDEVWEAYGEVNAPLFKNVPGIEALSITASARYTHYRSFGGSWTWKAGAVYSPIKEISFRGSYGTSFRAPALFEQYLGATSGFLSNTIDPCNNLTTASTAVRIANCSADGIGLGFTPTSSVAVFQKGGAASGLKAETSKNWTAGAIVQPSFGSAGNLSVSADYFNIKVSNGVSQLAASTILQQCYDDPRFRADAICSLVTRQSTAPFALSVVQGFVNISTAQVSGWDFNARYTVGIGKGKLRLTADVTRFNQRYNQQLPTDTIVDNIGTINNPKWSGTFDARYSIGRLDFHWGMDWLSGTNSPAAYLGLTQAQRDTYVMETPAYFLHNAAIHWRGDNFGLTFGVRNVFNTNPPQISSGFYNRVGNAPLYSGYDYAGRTFFVNVSTKLD